MKKFLGVLLVALLLGSCNINKQLPAGVLKDSLANVVSENIALKESLINKIKQCKENSSQKDSLIKSLKDSLLFYSNVRQRSFYGKIFASNEFVVESSPQKYKVLFQGGTIKSFIDASELLELPQGAKFYSTVAYRNIQIFSENNEFCYQLSFPGGGIIAFNNYIGTKNIKSFSNLPPDALSNEFKQLIENEK